MSTPKHDCHGWASFARVMYPPLTVLVGWSLLGSATARAREAAPTLEEIRAGIDRQWNNIRSMAYDYDSLQELAQPPDIVKRYTFNKTIMKGTGAFAFKGDKRYYKFDGPLSARDIAPGTEHEYDVIPGGKESKKELDEHHARIRAPGDMPTSNTKVHNLIGRKELGYNGERIIQAQGNQMVGILRPDQIQSFTLSFSHEYLENIARALPEPPPKDDDRSRFRVPDMFGSEGFQVRPELEPVDGSPCVVVVRPGHEMLWLDPKINYGVRRHEILFDDTPYVKSRRLNREWSEFAPGVWLPKVSVREECGPPLAPEPYRGMPLYRTVYTIKSLRINDVPDSRFEVPIEVGSTVVDATRLPPKDGRNQYVSYKMPADPARLDQVAAEALANRNAVGSRRWDLPSVLSIVNVVAIALIVTVFIRRRRQPSGTAP
jgi:hypothetical protein